LDNYFYKINITKAQLLLGFLVCLIGCSQQRDLIHFSGFTMGTTYSIKAIPLEKNMDTQILKKGIDSILFTLNKQMSTWDPSSEISLFNLLNVTTPSPPENQLHIDLYHRSSSPLAYRI